MIGEVLFGDYNLIVNDELLHSCTNYECYKGLYSSFNDKNLFEIAHSLNRQFGPEQWCIYRGKHLMTFADNHDVTRIASILNNPSHLPLVYGLLFSMPGIPCLYYGSEWGAEGMKSPDNDYALRPCFEKPLPNTLTDFVAKLSQSGKNHDALCNDSYRNVVIQNHQLIFERCSESERILVAVNAGGQRIHCIFRRIKRHSRRVTKRRNCEYERTGFSSSLQCTVFSNVVLFTSIFSTNVSVILF